MPKSIWARLDTLMRQLHLWTGLFLIPWMLIYAASALLLNHPELAKLMGAAPPTWREVERIDFTPNDSFPSEPKEQAQRLLAKVNLEGAHRIQGKPNPNQMVIIRIRGSGHDRVTWRKQENQVVVERQEPFSMIRLVHFLHFRHGYKQPVGAYLGWAAVVDFVVLSLALWVISGIYLWARLKRRWVSGGVCFAAGCGLFAVLVVLLCW